MQNDSAKDSGRPQQLAFPIVIAYNDFTAGAQAMHAYELLLEKLGADFEFHISLWKLSILSNPDLFRIAVGDAAGANMVILGLHQETDLSPVARQWLESWIPKKQRHAALLALLGIEKSAAPSHAETYLKNTAAAVDMDFLLQRFEPSANAGSQHLASSRVLR